MHTSSYDRVIAIFKSSGREYMDGFPINDLTDLSPSEKDEIKDMLVKRANQGDDVALRGLGKLLSKEEYLQFVEKLSAAHRSDCHFYAQLLTEICRIQGGDDVWTRVVDCLAGGDIFVRGWILNRLSDAPIPLSMHARLKAVLRNIIRTEHDKANLLSAVGTMLNLSGIKPRTEIYIDLGKRMRSQDLLIREQALTELEMDPINGSGN